METTLCVRCKKVIKPGENYCRFCGEAQRLVSQTPVIANSIAIPVTYSTNRRLVLTMWALYAMHLLLYFPLFGAIRHILTQGRGLSGGWAFLSNVNQVVWLVSLALSIWLLTRKSVSEKRHGGIVLLLHLIEFLIVLLFLFCLLSHLTLVS